MSGPMRGLSFLRDCLEDLAGLIEAAHVGRTYFPEQSKRHLLFEFHNKIYRVWKPRRFHIKNSWRVSSPKNEIISWFLTLIMTHPHGVPNQEFNLALQFLLYIFQQINAAFVRLRWIRSFKNIKYIFQTPHFWMVVYKLHIIDKLNVKQY